MYVAPIVNIPILNYYSVTNVGTATNRATMDEQLEIYTLSNLC